MQVFVSERHDAEKPQVVRRGHEDVSILAQARPFCGRQHSFRGETEAKNFRFARTGPELCLEQANKSQINVMLINHELVEIDGMAVIPAE